MSEYIIQTISKHQFNVHKFESSEIKPEATYVVTFLKTKISCTCLSGTYRGYCKHTKLVKEYKDSNKEFYSIEA